MRIAHLADVHLGFRRYAAMTPEGRNQREADVSAAWLAAVDGIVAAAPDLIVAAGDVFDSARPGNLAMRDAVVGVQRLRKVAPVLIVAGNHDEPKVDVGSPLLVLAQVGAKVVLKAEYVRLPALNTTVLCVPDQHIRRVQLQPNKDAGTHLLLAHGSVGGSLAAVADVLDPSAISEEFRYTALGDYHVAQEIRRDVWYSGSLDFVSSDPWREISGPAKGWLLVDTNEDSVTLNPVPTRTHIDLPKIDASGLDGQQLTAAILANIAATDPSQAVVRQVVTECFRGTKSGLAWRELRKASAPMLAWQLDITTAEQVQQALVPDDAPDWIHELEAEDEPLPDTPDEDCARRVAAIEAAADRGDLEALYEIVDQQNAAPAKAAAA